MLARLTLCLFTQLNAIRSILARPTLSIGTVSTSSKAANRCMLGLKFKVQRTSETSLFATASDPCPDACAVSDFYGITSHRIETFPVNTVL